MTLFVCVGGILMRLRKLRANNFCASRRENFVMDYIESRKYQSNLNLSVFITYIKLGCIGFSRTLVNVYKVFMYLKLLIKRPGLEQHQVLLGNAEFSPLKRSLLLTRRSMIRVTLCKCAVEINIIVVAKLQSR